MDGWTGGRVDGWAGGRVGGWAGGRVGGWAGGWVGGCHSYKHACNACMNESCVPQLLYLTHMNDLPHTFTPYIHVTKVD